jgi:23S rRNA pseudoU1915 N3-methylase RlmH
MGTSITFVTQYDVMLLKKIESYCETTIAEYSKLKPRDVKSFLIPVAQVVRTVKLDFDNSKVNEMQEIKKKRKRIQRIHLRKYSDAKSASSGSGNSVIDQ